MDATVSEDIPLLPSGFRVIPVDNNTVVRVTRITSSQIISFVGQESLELSRVPPSVACRMESV